MNSIEIETLIATAFPAATINVIGEGAKYDVTIVSELFVGKRPVARQQMVYAVLNEHISTGAIHAVTMNLKTIDETA